MKVSIQIVPDEQGGFVAECPSLPGCQSRGRTRDEAQDGMHEAIVGYLASVSNFVPERVVEEVVEV